MKNLTYQHSNYKVDFNGKLQQKEAVIKQIHCVHAGTFLVAEDEELYGLSQPNTWDKKWDEAYS